MKQRYDSYKPSGIDWIGEIPSHWEVIRFSFIFNAKAGGDAKPDLYVPDQDEEHPYPVYTNSLDKDSVYAYTSIAPFKKGSITVTGRGDVGHAIFREIDFDAIIRLLVLTPLKKADCKYFTYLIDGVQEFFTDNAAVGQLSAQQISKEVLIVPPLSEQQAIAEFLDGKCGEIDAAIAKVDREIELIDELKQSEISRVVTRGLNPDAPLRPSGIDWIGEIPSHWEIMRMRYLCDMITGDKDTVNKVDDGQYPFYVRSPQIERINSYTFDGEAVLMAGDGVGAGKVVHYVNGKFDFHQRVYNFHNFKRIKGILLYQYLKTLFKYKIEEGGAKNTVDSVRQPWLKDFPICVPPFAEQQEIAGYLDKKCAEIDGLKEKLVKKRETLKELRQAIISEVVTGKRKVI